MKRIFFCLLLVNSLSTEAQSLKWYNGSVVLTSGEVISGKMVVEPSLDVLLVEQNKVRTVYSAHKIKSFYYYDEFSDINRRFLSLQKSTLYNHHQFFEIVVQGEVSVLRRQKTRLMHPSDALDFTYYVTYRDDLMLLKKFGRKVYPQLKTSMERLEDFVSSNRLRAYDSSNSIRIIEYYNRQLRAEMITAKH